MAEMTTSTGIVCPHCDHEMTVKTEGFFGGLLKQMFIRQVLLGRRRGASVRCQNCGEWFTRRVATPYMRITNMKDATVYTLNVPYRGEAENGQPVTASAVLVSRSQAANETMIFAVPDTSRVTLRTALRALPGCVDDARALAAMGYEWAA